MSKTKDKSAFICFCVDGPSEKDAFKTQFEDLFDQIGGNNINIDFRWSEFQGENHGDITTLKGVTPDNVEKMIYKYYFKQQDKSSDLGWSDLNWIIHIIDLDGAYVPDEKVKIFTQEEKEIANSIKVRNKTKTTLYFDDHIAVEDNVQAMCERNKRKRQVIEHLLEITEIKIGKKTVNYCLYFFSSNLDHFLYGKANLTSNEKMREASDFAAFIDDADSLVNYFENNEYCEGDDYFLSWKKIRKQSNSLKRGSNINILINQITSSSLEDWL